MSMRSLAGAVMLALACAPAAVAQQSADQQPVTQQPPPAEDSAAAQESPVYEEQVIVSASKAEEQLVNAPATVSIIGPAALQTAPALNYGDLLRSVPGLNVTQTSARDVNLTSRGATSTLSTSQLALIDGRSIYLDFFGFVAWDFLPVNPAEIKQIEVIRGPASAIWGANALSGVVNVITKTPRELQGSSFSIGVGAFDRDTSLKEEGAGSLFYINGSHAQAVNDRWAYKITAGAYTQDPFARPTGPIPNGTGTQYPDFANSGTTQPKFDVRADYDFPDGARKLVFQGGVAGTEGIMHTGIGPFDIDRGTVLGYGKVNYSRGPLKANFFVNVLNGDATNLLSVDPLGNPVNLVFKSQTYDAEVGNVQTLASRHILSYGGNFRHSSFDLSLAPNAKGRTEGGAYVQDEIFLSKYFRWVVGARLDKFDVIDNAQFSPRTSLLIKPAPDHTVRLSYNRAYRAPSVINNYLDTTISEPINLGLFSPLLAGRIYRLPIMARGDRAYAETHPGAPALTEQSVTAYEVGYTGIVNKRATVSLAWYYNEFKDDIYFTEIAGDRWTATNPPPGWPLPPFVINLVPGRSFPASFSYRNLGRVKQQGFEAGIDGAINRELSVFANYSFQPEPSANFPKSELNIPPRNRFNIGGFYDGSRFLGNLSVNYADSAYWQDVLDARYAGETDAYTLVNGTFGIKFGPDGRIVTSLKVNNLLNEEVQQHIFGDIIKRQIVGELRVTF